MYKSSNPIVSFAVNSRVNAILSQVNKGESVLEAGCCEGYIAIPVARRVGKGGKVACIDIEQEYLDFAKKKSELEGLDNLIFQKADVSSFKSPEKFDKIICSEVLEHVDDPLKVMRNLVESLRDGGKLIITVPNEFVLQIGRKIAFGSKAESLEEVTAHKSELKASDVVELGLKLGLTKDSVSQVPFPLIYLNEVIVLRK